MLIPQELQLSQNKRFSGWFTFFQNYSFLYKKNRIFAPVKTKFDL